MRIAISNLAWDPAEDAQVAELMGSLGVEGLEIAPTRIWESPLSSSSRERQEYRKTWGERGIRIVSLQALLFGRPELALFDSAASRAATLEFLRGMIELAADLGATRLVFGSPRNRARGTMTIQEADEVALPFFRTIGDFAVEAGVVFCIEPNPPQYECDWITTLDDGHRFAVAVAHEGIAVNADSGGITLAGEDPSVVIPRAIGSIGHFHISEPQLAPLGTGGVHHPAFAEALRASTYRGWASVEMRPPPGNGRIEVLADSLRAAVEMYG